MSQAGTLGAKSDGADYGWLQRYLKPASDNRSVGRRVAASFLDGEVREDAPGLGASEGERLPTSPRVAATLNARYDFSAAKLPAFVALNAGHVGDRTVSFSENVAAPNYTLPEYTTVDLNGGSSVAGWELGAYVRNVGDERGQVSAYTQFQEFGVPNWLKSVDNLR